MRAETRLEVPALSPNRPMAEIRFVLALANVQHKQYMPRYALLVAQPSSTMATFFIRPFQSGDEQSLLDICIRTGRNGSDASGELSNDDLLGHVYALPYAVRDPGLALVVVRVGSKSDNETVVGYCVATDDTLEYNAWYRDDYWPRVFSQLQSSGQRSTDSLCEREKDLIASASGTGHAKQSLNLEEVVVRTQYPAHLHINLLPEAQGQGLGKKLVAGNVDKLVQRGCKGVHLGTSKDNLESHKFYRKCGFREEEVKGHTLPFTMDLRGGSQIK
jgi:ribosomal protein S18 acetylase RimI-like enzyme